MAKLSVSLPEQDVQTLDAYAASRPGATRSAAIQQAIALLRERVLVEQYDAAMDAWEGSDEARDWDQTTGDAL